MSSMRARVVVFIGLVLGVVAATLAYLLAGGSDTRGANGASTNGQGTATPGASAAEIKAALSVPHIVFRSTALGPSYGRVAIVPLAHPDAAPTVTGLACERVYTSGPAGICLSADRGVVTTYRTVLLGPDMAVRAVLPVAGLPSRARTSLDGRFGVTTTFVTGHSYAQSSFSTATVVYDMATQKSVANLEDFSFELRGAPYRAVDINVWGVTFAADGRHFFATVASAGTTHLARGDLSTRTITMLATKAECPSLSPDGTRVAYKSRTGANSWRLHVLTLATGEDVALAERRSVDDQAIWVDDHRIGYALPVPSSARSDVWVTPADGSGTPRILVPNAWSPAVVSAPAG